MPLVGSYSKTLFQRLFRLKYTVETAKGVGSVLGLTQPFGIRQQEDSQGPLKAFPTTNGHQEVLSFSSAKGHTGHGS